MLTDTKIKNAKPRDRVYRMADKNGLCIEIRPTGAKFWRYRFRYDGAAKMMSLGRYPQVSLLDARQRHMSAHALLADGINPIEHAKRVQASLLHERQDLFAHHAQRFIAKMEGKRSAGYIRQLRHHLDRYILPMLGDKPIKQIDTVDVMQMMHRVLELVRANEYKRGSGEVTAELCRQQTGLVFRHAMRSVRGLHDPTPAAKGEIERPPIEHARDLTLDELKALLQKLQNYGGMPSTKGVIYTMLYTMCRTKEARYMRWAHIDWTRQLWSVPLADIHRRKQGERHMKTDKPHVVPLSTQMMALLEQMHPISGLGEFVFPSNKTPTQPIGAVTVNSALSYMGFDFTGHDLRATGSTYLHGLGYDTQHINLQMAHVDNSISGIYNHALWLPERTQMMQAWADYLDGLA